MKALTDRLRWVLTTRGLTQRALGVKAGLSEQFISVYFQRAKKDPAASISADALAAIAAAAGVSIAWLANGEGRPDVEIRLEREERYPNRRRALDAVRGDYDPEAVRNVEGIAFQRDDDLTVREWIGRLDDEEKRLAWNRAHPAAAQAKAQGELDALVALEAAHRAAAGLPAFDEEDELPPPEGSIAWRERQAKKGAPKR